MRDRLIELIGDLPFSTEYESYNSLEWAEHFADYLLANGVIVPPCKVGEKVWVIIDGFRNPMKGYISRISFYQDCEDFAVRVIGYLTQTYQSKDFGKTVFFSCEEAEAKLKEGANNE